MIPFQISKTSPFYGFGGLIVSPHADPIFCTNIGSLYSKGNLGGQPSETGGIAVPNGGSIYTLESTGGRTTTSGPTEFRPQNVTVRAGSSTALLGFERASHG